MRAYVGVFTPPQSSHPTTFAILQMVLVLAALSLLGCGHNQPREKELWYPASWQVHVPNSPLKEVNLSVTAGGSYVVEDGLDGPGVKTTLVVENLAVNEDKVALAFRYQGKLYWIGLQRRAEGGAILYSPLDVPDGVPVGPPGRPGVWPGFNRQAGLCFSKYAGFSVAARLVASIWPFSPDADRTCDSN